MIQRYRDSHKGSSIAILGSGPTVELYKAKEDLAIAVNGAAKIERPFDIFMAGDNSSPHMDWFLAADTIRMVSSYVSPYDPFLYPDEADRVELQADLGDHIEHNYAEKFPFVRFVPDISPQEPHVYFLFGGMGIGYIKDIKPDQEFMYWGGTISAIALQMAMVMGADDINLYGCGFDNDSGKNYHYPTEDKGATSLEQRMIMQATIDRIREMGKNINIHGPSRLK